MGNYKLTDPEFSERFEHFAFDEVVNEEGQQLDGITRHMAVAATLIGCTIWGSGASFLFSTRQMISSSPEASISRLKARQRRQWKTVWKKVSRRRPTSSAPT